MCLERGTLGELCAWEMLCTRLVSISHLLTYYPPSLSSVRANSHPNNQLTPNLGQGGNSAIESAAVLANTLYHHRCTASNHSYASALSEYAHLRVPRTTEIHSIASWVTRVQARDGFVNRIFGKYIARYAGDVPLNIQSSFIGTAPSLDYLPEPERTKECWMPYDDTLPERPTPWKRFVNTGWVFIPFLVGSYLYPRVPASDAIPKMSIKAANFVSTTLLLLESNRCGNVFSPANLAPLFIAFSSWSASSAFRLPLPLYHLLHYCFLSPFSYLSLDQRSVTYHHALTTPLAALATVFLGNWTALTPVHSILAFPFRQRARQQRLEKPLDDIPVLAVVYAVAMVAAVVEGGFGKRVGWEEVSQVVWAALGAWEAGGRAWGGFVGMTVVAGAGWPWVAAVAGAAWREWALVGMRR